MNEITMYFAGVVLGVVIGQSIGPLGTGRNLIANAVNVLIATALLIAIVWEEFI